MGAAVFAVATVLAPSNAALSGWSFDTLVWLRLAVFGAELSPEQSPTVVVAIDEETYRREPFESTPKVMWTNELAVVIDEIMNGGASVLGFDVVLPTSVASRVRDFDRPFLQSLRRHAVDGRIVLSKVQHSLKPILPSPGQRFAVGHNTNLRSANLFTDDDGIVRGVPIAFPIEGQTGAPNFEKSFSAELAYRALNDRLTIDNDGSPWRDGVRIPTVGSNNLLINFDSNQSNIPTYSLADLNACAEAGNTEYFRRHFSDKIVLLGSILDIEDRKLSALRFGTAPDISAYVDRCVHPPMTGLLSSEAKRDSIPGVYIHAFAVNNFVHGNFTSRPGIVTSGIIALSLVFLTSLAVLYMPLIWAVATTIAGATGWAVAATVMLKNGLALPLIEPILALAMSFALLSVYRFSIADRDKRLLRKMFGLYLSPSIIEGMVEQGKMPALGGETRELTVFFSDLEGFASISEQLPPDVLVGLLNRYLSAMAEIIEFHGGFVDKYIGDEIIAVFGAPHDDRAHAENAINAAMECQHRLTALNDDLEAENFPRLSQRIGINSGAILVGNIGSQRRFNYTVIGDAVNLASRIEGANKVYGTQILVSEDAIRHCSSDIIFREIDTVRVVGRDEPVRLYQPIGSKESIKDTDVELKGVFEKGLAVYRSGEFKQAVEIWTPLTPTDPAAEAMVRRTLAFSKRHPEKWDGVFNLDTK